MKGTRVQRPAKAAKAPRPKSIPVKPVAKLCTKPAVVSPGISRRGRRDGVLCGSDVQAQHQRHRVLRRFLKAVVLVKLPCAVVECMDEQGAHARVLRHHHGSIHRVLKQGGAKLDALCAMVNREPCQHHHRNRIWHVSAHATRRHRVRYRACRHRVVAENASARIRDDEAAAGPAQLVGKGSAPEPFVEAGLPAGKFIQEMHRREGLRCAQLQAHAASPDQGAFTAIRRSSPGLGPGGASSRAVNCLNLSASRLKKT